MTILEDLAKSRFLGIFCLLLIIILYLFGLWPLNFRPVNKVSRVKDGPGVHFRGQGIIYSPGLLRISESANSGRLSIEIALSPDRESDTGLSYILSFLDDNDDEFFFVAQWKTVLILLSNIRTPDGRVIERKMGIDALRKGNNYLISVTSGPDGTTLYLNGERKARQLRFRLSDIPEARIVLGNSVTGKNEWFGKISALCLSNDRYSDGEVRKRFSQWQSAGFLPEDPATAAHYDFKEKSGDLVRSTVNSPSADLVAPATFKMLKKTVLSSPRADFRFRLSYFQDVLVNVLGFMPFGFFQTAFLIRKRFSAKTAVSVTVLSGLLISLSIELIQVYLPTRSSQMTDVIMNAAGTIMGALPNLKGKGFRKS